MLGFTRRKRFLVPFCLLLLALIFTSVSAQTNFVNVTFDRVVTAGFPEVDAYISIYGQNGLPIEGIDVDDLVLMEDGTPVDDFTLDEVMNVDTPLAVALVIDSSGSMVDNGSTALVDAKAAAIDYVNRLNAHDSVGVISFSDEVTVAQDLTTEKIQAVDAIEGIEAAGNTAMYDALLAAVNLLKESGKKNVVILLTDGKDSVSTSDLEDAVEAAKTWHIPIYPLGFGGVDEEELNGVAEKTGGMAKISPDSSDLSISFNQISQLLRNVYRISFTSSVAGDSASHELSLIYTSGGEEYSDTISFVPKPVAISFLTPQPGETISIETEIVAEISSAEKISTVKFLIDGAEVKLLTAPTEGLNTFKYFWDLGSVSPGSHEIKVVAEDVQENTQEASINVTVRNPINIDIQNPSDDDVIQISPMVKVAVDSVKEISEAVISIDDQVWQTFTGTEFEEQWQIHTYPEGTHVIKVEVTDVEGHTASEEIQIQIGDAVVPSIQTDAMLTPGSGGGGGGTGGGGGLSNGMIYLIIGGGVALIAFVIVIPMLLKKKRQAQPAASIQATPGQSSGLVIRELEGLNPGQVWQVGSAEIRLGRKREDNDIPLKGLNASRRMAVIRLVEGALMIYSLNPTNPIIINGQSMPQQVMLEVGDQITLGESVFVVSENS